MHKLQYYKEIIHFKWGFGHSIRIYFLEFTFKHKNGLIGTPPLQNAWSTISLYDLMTHKLGNTSINRHHDISKESIGLDTWKYP